MKRRACIVPREQDVRRREAELSVAHMAPEARVAALHSVRHLSKIAAIRQLMTDLNLDVFTAKKLVDGSPVLAKAGATTGRA